MNIIAAVRLLLDLRNWWKSRTLNAAAGGLVAGPTLVLAPELVTWLTNAFNAVSPVDLTEAQMSGVALFVISLVAAVLRAKTVEPLSTKEASAMQNRLLSLPFIVAGLIGFAVAGSMLVGPTSIDAQPRGVLIYSETYDAASTADGAGVTNAIAAPGAVLGDFCIGSVGVDVVDMTITCNIVADGSAEVRMQNESGTGPVDLASTTWRVLVIPKGTR